MWATDPAGPDVSVLLPTTCNALIHCLGLESTLLCALDLQGILLVSIPFCILGYLAMGVWLDCGGRSIRANVAVITAGGGMAFGVFYGAPAE